RMRLNLARVLFVPSDLLLLDEPTNHLDLDAIVWLERWLTRYPGTVVVVSHDRDFLDRVAQATLSIESRQLVRYAGGYTAYEAQRSERLSQGLKAHAAQRARIERLNGFISRFRAKATKARQVQSRVKALEKLQLAAPMRIDHGIEISLPTVLDAPDPLLVAEQLDAGYSGLTVLEGVN
ncbi:MAG: ABC transporter, partial [Quisquiliibacterium sp.]